MQTAGRLFSIAMSPNRQQEMTSESVHSLLSTDLTNATEHTAVSCPRQSGPDLTGGDYNSDDSGGIYGTDYSIPFHAISHPAVLPPTTAKPVKLAPPSLSPNPVLHTPGLLDYGENTCPGEGQSSCNQVNRLQPFSGYTSSHDNIVPPPDLSLTYGLANSVPAGLLYPGTSVANTNAFSFQPLFAPIQQEEKTHLVSLALRKRSGRQVRHTRTIPSHKRVDVGRPLDPKTRVRLTLVPNLPSLHSMLVPPYRVSPIRVLNRGSIDPAKVDTELLLDDSIQFNKFGKQEAHAPPGLSQAVVLVNPGYRPDPDESIDSASLAQFPNAIGFERSNTKKSPVPIYDNFDNAVEDTFHLKQCTLARVTRAAAFEKTGAIVLKLETAHPGDVSLNDEGFGPSSDSHTYLGHKGDPITPVFIKKKIARPRYKANMRIYLLPRAANVVLYSEEEMLRRDLMTEILDLKTERRMILCSFDYTRVLRELGLISG